MRTEWDVGTLEKQVGAGSSELGAKVGAVAMLAAIAAALLFLLGSAWFASGAGADYPEPYATLTD
ncbi:MAG TPA: hypothetical protein VF912_17375 [Anaeromyxobacter sp.]